MRRALILVSRIFARFHFWMASAWVLELAGPLADLDASSVGRLAYTLMMSSDQPSAHRLFRRLLRRNLGKSAPVNLALADMAQRLGRLRLARLIHTRTSATPGNSLQHASAHSMAELLQGILSGTLYADIGAAVDSLNLTPGQAETVILVPVSTSYLDLFQLWIEQARQYAHGDLVAVALDPAAREILERDFSCRVLDLSPFFVFDSAGRIDAYSRNWLWVLRVIVLRELIPRGYTVLSLDLDAILLDDVNVMLSTFPQVDIVAQKDYSLPVDVARDLGFVLCCGFMLFRPTQPTIAFLDGYRELTIQELHDQIALNHLIARAGTTNMAKTDRYMTFQSAGVAFLCPDKSLVSRDIKYGSVIRHFQQIGQSIARLRSELGLGG
jgi:hypothetical protein